jgi:hypothetical protein
MATPEQLKRAQQTGGIAGIAGMAIIGLATKLLPGNYAWFAGGLGVGLFLGAFIMIQVVYRTPSEPIS